ncbi:hypothetical protein [Tardiphaga sp. 709]|uniref:hypothetical protein n=1 Tax=Tardiphaga sp. 709 TaxID=3076039 RepID=UPI0028EA751C|nr:hypothetical protein [Tardiphaga sp. 709]WNV10099.1 hypothetical protein RSO67_02565 [Tardiphaga sp. 709]
MSLAELVFRNLTVLALTDQTLAGSEVRSSLLVPLNELQEKPQPVPMIAVFTDSARAEDAQIEGNDLFGAQAAVTLALEIGCVGKALTTDGQNVETFIPETDEGMEMTIDVIRRQAIVTLQSGASVWASLWRDCRVKTRSISVERGAAVEKGVRFAAKRVELRIELVSDPVPGAALPKFWLDCLAALDADDRTKNLAIMLRRLAIGAQMPAWRSWQAELGLIDAGIRALGVAPFEGAEEETGEGTLSVTISAGDDVGDELTVDADGATLTIGNGEPVPVQEVANG